MKKLTLKLIVALLALTLVLVPLASCGANDNGGASTTTAEGNKNEAPSLDKDLEIKIYLLNGTTALGASKLISDAKADKTDMNYNIETFAAADSITGAIVTGECAIAALPTNAAANLYKKSAGKVQLLAINTLGVLYLLNNGEDVTDFDSLKGKTVYLPGAGSNPEFITAALFEANGLSKDDVTLDTATYPSPDALSAAVISGDAKLAVLPQPKVTAVMSKNTAVEIAMDFTAEWEEVYGKDTMAQGCLVVNTQFANDHPAELSKFLDDYKASVEFIAGGSDEAIATIVETGILPSAAIAKTALPSCNVCFIEGKAMKDAISVFYEKLYASNNKSIAAIPDDNFYYAR